MISQLGKIKKCHFVYSTAENKLYRFWNNCWKTRQSIVNKLFFGFERFRFSHFVIIFISFNMDSHLNDFQTSVRDNSEAIKQCLKLMETLTKAKEQLEEKKLGHNFTVNLHF